MLLSPPSRLAARRRLRVNWFNRAWTPLVLVSPGARRSGLWLCPRPSRRVHAPAFRISAPNLSSTRAKIMLNTRFQPRRRSAGFTLIELLVVITIIGILASLLLPALGAVKKSALKGRAKTEISAIVAAINQYDSTYSRMPASTRAAQVLTAACPDFTFGTAYTNGSPVVTPLPAPAPILCHDYLANADLPYQAPNSEVIAIIMDQERYPIDGSPTVNFNHAKNPQKTSFLNAKMVGDNLSSGVGTDLVYRDPWGRPYIITMDMNGDNKTRDSFYTQKTVSQLSGGGPAGYNGLVQADASNNGNTFESSASVMVWSLGPDGKTDATQNAKTDPNKDNILSWQ